jgi:hypothetical protein
MGAKSMNPGDHMDPNEKKPVVPEPPAPPAPASTEGYTPEEEEEVRKRLEDLGYI